MKNIQKITVLASTVLLSTVFSPKAHAESENPYNLDQAVEASENLEINKTTEEKSQNLQEVPSDEILEKDIIQEDNAKEIQATAGSSVDETKAKKIEEPTSEVEDIDQELEISPSEQITLFRATSSVRSVEEDRSLSENRSAKEEKSDEPIQVTTYSNKKTDSFSHEDLYIYSKVDLDKGLIGNKSSSSSGSSQKTNQTEQKVVDKSSDGKYVLKTDGKKNYYYDNGVLMKNKDTVLNGKFYTLGSDGSANVARNKWVNVNGVKYFANENGYTQIGLKKIGNTTYHFQNNGKLSSNDTIFTNGTFYKINNKGIASTIRNQWVTYNGQTYYVDKKGGKANGFTRVSGKLYNFNNGVMTENIPVFYSGDKFYKVDSRGQVKMFTNSWVNYKGKEFYVNGDGWRCEGITNINGKVYNLTKNGKAKDYYVYSKKDNATYYFDYNGVGTIVSRGKPSKDLDVMLGWMYDGMNNNMTYDMGAGRTSKNASDCSSAVFRSMILGGFREEGSFIGNTETLFSLGKKGEVLKEISESEIRYGDIFVAGTPGNSNGAGGHTGFIVDKNTIIHSNYTDNGINVTQRKGRMGDASGLPIKYYRLVGGTSRRLYI